MADVGPPRDRFCPTCGTEVDDEARFCPTCGTPLNQEEELNLPPAPAWPPPMAPDEAGGPSGPAATEAEALPAQPMQTEAPVAQEPAAPEPEEAPAPPPSAPPPSAAAPSPGGPAPAEAAPSGPVELPITWPTTLSGWLIGVGSLVGALALIPSLTNAVSLLLFLALLGVAATVFLAERLPAVPRLRLITLAVTLVGLGIGFERAGFGARGISTILFLAMIGAAGGALLIELDRDRPLPPPARPGD